MHATYRYLKLQILSIIYVIKVRLSKTSLFNMHKLYKQSSVQCLKGIEEKFAYKHKSKKFATCDNACFASKA
jgi:hypothetical protein